MSTGCAARGAALGVLTSLCCGGIGREAGCSTGLAGAAAGCCCCGDALKPWFDSAGRGTFRSAWALFCCCIGGCMIGRPECPLFIPGEDDGCAGCETGCGCETGSDIGPRPDGGRGTMRPGPAFDSPVTFDCAGDCAGACVLDWTAGCV